MKKLVGRGRGHARPLLAVVIGLVFLSATGTAWSQSIARQVATVRLYTPEIINSRQFTVFLDLAARLRGGAPLNAEECRLALDNLTNKRLYLQEADQRRLTPTEAEIDMQLAAVRRQAEQDLGLDHELSDDEWRAVVQQNTRLNWHEYRQQFADGLSLQRLVVQMQPGLLQIKPPTEQEIEHFYNANIQQFVQPETALIQHIHFASIGLDKEGVDQVRTRVDDVLRELRAGASFDDLVVKHSDDGTSRYRGGELGNRYIRRDDPAVLKTLGTPFLEAAFTLAVGEISGVVTSDVGFHLLRLVDRIAPRLLTIDDRVLPRSTQTVGQQIANLIDSRRQNQEYLQAVEETVQVLRKQADVTVFKQEVEKICQKTAG